MSLTLPYLRRFYLLFISLVCIVFVSKAQDPDLPGAVSNLQTADVGTLVIAMDNTNQATSANLFNLKAYGFAIFLMDLDVDLRWVITAGKAHDAIDFTATAERAAPTYLAPQTYNFRAGPILIFPADTTGVTDAIIWFNEFQPDSCKVKVYRLTQAVTVDVRYNLTKRVRAALIHDSCDIHANFMEMASVPTMNYECIPDASTLSAGCYTIATEPHASTIDVSFADSDSIYSFLMAGGNFLAECEGVPTMENRMKFQSTTGLIIEPPSPQINNFNNTSNIIYSNADMAYGQYEGDFQPRLRGALQLWRYTSDNPNINNYYSVTSSRRNANDSIWNVATVSKLTSGTGSLVFYLGNHEYFTNDCHTCVAGSTINQKEINGIRVYLNAVLVPAAVPDCIFNIPLAVQMDEFTAYKKNNSAVQLNWSTATEDSKTMFFVEHSRIGTNFSTIGEVMATGNTNTGDNYAFLHSNPAPGTNFYRLKIISLSGKITYSEIKKVIFAGKNQTLNLYPNPATGKTNLILDAKDGERLQVKIYDASGRQVKSFNLNIRSQQAELDIDGLHNGIYWVVASMSYGKQFTCKLQVLQ